MPEFCPECETMSDRRYETRREVLIVRDVPIEVEATVAVCLACGEDVEDEVLDSASLQAAYDIYHITHDY
jgi:hypothetical protein